MGNMILSIKKTKQRTNKNRQTEKQKIERHEVNSYLGYEWDPDSCIRLDELEQDLSSNIF